jgi:hypothetical protein
MAGRNKPNEQQTAATAARQAIRQPNGGREPNGGPEPPPPPPPPPPVPPFQPAFYIFRLDSFTITNTRASDEDTDHVTVGLKVGDAMPDPQTRHMGDVDNGTHQVGIQFGPILVTTPNDPVAFNYQIVNNGHSSDADIERQLTASAIALLAKVFSLSTPWTAILGVVVDIILRIVFADCDGPVAVDQINLSGQSLWAWTHGVGAYSETRFYPGTDSDFGCGSNSEYYVTWSIVGAGLASPPVLTGVLVPQTVGLAPQS